MHYDISLRAGNLSIDTRREDYPLDSLLDFASRQNPKRGFLFVSKVLGKHIPCRPARMREIYDRLAEPLAALPGPIVVIGMAETATGLGAGVADSLGRNPERDDILYIHTTRHHLDAPTLLGFDESHSHAPDHLLYAPLGERAIVFGKARSLVLVDDEISTGRTLQLLAEHIAIHLHHLQSITLTAIVNWLTPARQRIFKAANTPLIQFNSLLEGEFVFQANPEFRPALPVRTHARRQSHYARSDTGRTGLLIPAEIKRLPIVNPPDGPLTIVGTGEFSFVPFLAAERLEQLGRDVLFQSTTRSPIMRGEAIRRKLAFDDEHGEDIVNYIYNLPEDRRTIVAYEHPAMAEAHEFPRRVGADVWALAE